MIGYNFLIHALALIFIQLFDSVAYMLVSLSYRVFLLVTELDLFGGGTGGANLYEIFTQKVYLILSVVMLFIFAYQLVLLLINPDGDGTKKTTGLLKDFTISIGLIVVLPTIFKYMTVLQLHIIHDNTIGALVLGTAPNTTTSSEQTYGDSIAMTILMAFYHPQGTGYDAFFDTTGNFKGVDQAVEDCVSVGEASEDTCRLWATALEDWNSKVANGTTFGKINTITNNGSIIDTIGEDDGSYYMWVISTGCAILVAWFFISYAIDLGTRAVKLGFLEIIAPIPVMFNAVPKMKKSFDTWKSELIKTYVELFARVAVIFFVVKLCTLVPEFVSVIFHDSTSEPYTSAGLFERSIVMVVLILGLLKFAKEAPELFKALFDNGGGLFKGLNFKPGVKGRVESNEYAMKGASMAVGAGVGMIGNAMQRYRQARFDANGNELKNSSRIGGVFTALTAAPRGVITGAKSGLEHSAKNLSFKDFQKTGKNAIADAHASEENAFNRDFRTAVRQTYRDNRDDGRTNAEDSMLIQHAKDNFGEWKNKKDAHREAFRQDVRDFGNELSGIGKNVSDRELQALNNISENISSLKNYNKAALEKLTENLNKAANDMKKKIYESLTDGKISSAEAQRRIKEIEKTRKEQYNSIVSDFYKKNTREAENLASGYKQLEKNLRNSQINSNTMALIDQKISGAGIAGVSNVSELVAAANSALAAKDYGKFATCKSAIEDISKTIDSVKEADKLTRNIEADNKKKKEDKK